MTTEAKCVCRSFCRSDLWGQMIDGRKYHAPSHADGCPAQVREPFTVIELDGTRCVMEPKEAKEFISFEPDERYTVSTVMLTRDQYNRMEEFNGF